VLECLQRSVKTADMCSLASSQHVHLFVEVLNHYLCFYEAGCPTVTEKYVSALISFINDKRAEGDVRCVYCGSVGWDWVDGVICLSID
jgi:hypothetical protein